VKPLLTAESTICRSRAPATRNVVQANSKKTDIKKQGLESIKNAVVKQNLMGVSASMNKKGWTDPSGRKGKVYSAACSTHFLWAQ